MRELDWATAFAGLFEIFDDVLKQTTKKISKLIKIQSHNGWQFCQTISSPIPLIWGAKVESFIIRISFCSQVRHKTVALCKRLL